MTHLRGRTARPDPGQRRRAAARRRDHGRERTLGAEARAAALGGHQAGMTRGAGVRRRLPPGRSRSPHALRVQPGELAAPARGDRSADDPAPGIRRPRRAPSCGSAACAVRMLGDLERLTPAARARGRHDRVARPPAAPRLPSTSASPTAPAPRSPARRGCWPKRCRPAGSTPAEVDEAALAARLYTAEWPDPDLLIRTSGEHRLSNFLLWQIAYAEFHVRRCCGPTSPARHLFEAILDFQRRDRRFGRVPASP